MTWYLDASAIIKLVAFEAESAALNQAMERSQRQFATSELSLTEVRRGALRKGPAELAKADRVLARMDVVPLSRELLLNASVLEPSALRSLDAIHIASALALSTELDALVTYDRRMREAAELAGITVIAPGQTD